MLVVMDTPDAHLHRSWAQENRIQQDSVQPEIFDKWWSGLHGGNRCGTIGSSTPINDIFSLWVGRKHCARFGPRWRANAENAGFTDVCAGTTRKWRTSSSLSLWTTKLNDPVFQESLSFRELDAMNVLKGEANAKGHQTYHSQRESLMTSLSRETGEPDAMFPCHDVFKFADPGSIGKSFLEGNKDHLLNQARFELVKQGHQVGSFNSCIQELRQQVYTQRLDLEDAVTDILNLEEQSRLQEEASSKEKVLRNRIRSMHEMWEMKRAQELWTDKVFAKNRRKSRNNSTFHFPSAANKCKNKWILWVILEILRMWNQIIVGDCHTFPVKQQAFQVLVPCSAAIKDCSLYMGKVWTTVKRFFFLINFLQLTHPEIIIKEFSISLLQILQDRFRELLEHKILSQDCERQNRGTTPLPTFARRSSTMISTVLDFPKNSMVGQQRQQISDLRIDNFLSPVIIFMMEGKIQNQNDYMFWFFIGDYVMDRRSGDDRLLGGTKIFAISFWKVLSKIRDTWSKNCFCLQ